MSAASAVDVTVRTPALRRLSACLAQARLGLAAMALVVGAGARLGAAGFRELIFAATWLATGHTQFGQQGHAPSLHLPFLGPGSALAGRRLGELSWPSGSRVVAVTERDELIAVRADTVLAGWDPLRRGDVKIPNRPAG